MSTAPPTTRGVEEPQAAPVRIGWARVEITPPRAVALVGQHAIRIGEPTQAFDPLMATVMAIESDSQPGEQAVLVSVDAMAGYDVGMRLGEILAQRAASDPRLASLDGDRIVLFATHSHTAPYYSNKPGIPAGTMDGDGYRAFLLPRLADAVTEAWATRKIGSLGRASAQADIGYNRIATYRDGSAQMYGETASPNFVAMQGTRDPTVELLYHFDETGEVVGVVVNLACPAQVLENHSRLSADFWHEARVRLRAHPDLPDDLFILPMCSAAGDQSPRNLEDPTLTRDDTRGQRGTRTIGEKITAAVLAGLPEAHARKADRLIVRHDVHAFDLPRKPQHADAGPFPVVLHTLGLGEAVIVDNPFELYLDYGLEIKRQSAADQTLIAQLASGPAYGTYLPTEKAQASGGYGSRPENGEVGPEGGRQLVAQTLAAIDQLFDQKR